MIKYFVKLRFSACTPGFKKNENLRGITHFLSHSESITTRVSSDMLLGVLTRIYFHRKEICNKQKIIYQKLGGKSVMKLLQTNG